jgi:hypothetical protein
VSERGKATAALVFSVVVFLALVFLTALRAASGAVFMAVTWSVPSIIWLRVVREAWLWRKATRR